MAKIHLALSEVPLQKGKSLTAVCNSLIASADILAIWDGQEMNVNVEAPLQLGVCRKCCQLISETIKGNRYVYGVTERKEERA